MTSRRTILILCALSLCFTQSTWGADRIELGKLVKRTIEGERKLIVGNPGTGYWYQHEMTVRLKAGQSISVEATVTGKDRLVNIVVAEPKGAVISSNAGPPRVKKSIDVEVEEVAATGDYKILVVSDLVGPFELKVVEIGGDEDSIEALESKIKDLNNELADLEKRLKAAKAKRGAK